MKTCKSFIFAWMASQLLTSSCSKQEAAKKTERPKFVTLATNQPKKATAATSGAANNVTGGLLSVDPRVVPFTEPEAMAFLNSECSSCHETGKDYSSFWRIPVGGYSLEKLQTDPSAFRVFAAIKQVANKVVAGDPSPMPPNSLTEQATENAKKFVAFLQKQAPDIVLEAHANYGNESSGNQVKVNYNFRCEKPASFRKYIRRVTNDAFNREPTNNELLLAGDSPDVPTTSEMRNKIALKMRNDASWVDQFENVGLKKFANKVAGSFDMKATGAITPTILPDVQTEFYQTLMRKYRTKSWKDILLSDEIFVSSVTAPLYGCTNTDPAAWVSCKMPEERSTFFASYGFLLSKNTSFLSVNNNYGRVAGMVQVINGQGISAATSGPRGSEVITPLPECLKTKDYRGIMEDNKVAPFGTAKIPLSGNVCQSCHVSRNLAGGSILFRKFAGDGSVVTPEKLDEAFAATDGYLKGLLGEALKDIYVNQQESNGAHTPVDVAFLKSLLDFSSNTELACSMSPGELNGKALTSLHDLARSVVATEATYAKGLASHIPKSISNKSETTLELQTKMVETYNKENGLLIPIFAEYFASETYACE